MSKRRVAAAATIVLLVTVAACSSRSSSRSQSTPPPVVATATTAPTPGIAFTDLAGVAAAPAILDLAALDVFGTTGGEFRPDDAVTRSEFVRWLVKADDAIYASDPSKQIHPADKTADATFSDVPASHPDFPYVQGMVAAGYPVAFGDALFHPNDLLNREQMIALKIAVDAGQVKDRSDDELSAMWGYAPDWSDKESIEKKYRLAFIEGYYPNDKYGNVGRVWGTLKTFQPFKTVTRAEAALALSAFYPHDDNPTQKPDTAADAVARLAAMTPVPSTSSPSATP